MTVGDTAPERTTRGRRREDLAASLDDAAPHLSEAERAQLQHAYLGNLTWRQACHAIGVPFDELPDTVHQFGV